MNCSIYALLDPDTDEIRYVGQTTKTLGHRLNKHINIAKKGKTSHLWCWIRNILENNKKPIIALLQDDAIWNESEIKWIKCLREDGYNLVNTTEGGNGTLGRVCTPEKKAKISKSLKGRKVPAEVIEKCRQSRIGKKRSTETKEKMSAIAAEKFGQKVVCVETGIIYPSFCNAAKAVGCCHAEISRSTRTKFMAKGLHWRLI